MTRRCHRNRGQFGVSSRSGSNRASPRAWYSCKTLHSVPVDWAHPAVWNSRMGAGAAVDLRRPCSTPSWQGHRALADAEQDRLAVWGKPSVHLPAEVSAPRPGGRIQGARFREFKRYRCARLSLEFRAKALQTDRATPMADPRGGSTDARVHGPCSAVEYALLGASHIDEQFSQGGTAPALTKRTFRYATGAHSLGLYLVIFRFHFI